MAILACWTMLGLKVILQTVFPLLITVVTGGSGLAKAQRQEVFLLVGVQKCERGEWSAI